MISTSRMHGNGQILEFLGVNGHGYRSAAKSGKLFAFPESMTHRFHYSTALEPDFGLSPDVPKSYHGQCLDITCSSCLRNSLSVSNTAPPSMESSGCRPLLAPGFNGIPLDEEINLSKPFAHGFGEWKQVPAITIREFTITSAINALTERPNWNKDVFYSGVVSRSCKELVQSCPLLNATT